MSIRTRLALSLLHFATRILCREVGATATGTLLYNAADRFAGFTVGEDA